MSNIAPLLDRNRAFASDPGVRPSMGAIDRVPALTAAAAIEAAPHPTSRHRVLAPEDGTVHYRQIDNFSLTHRVMFDRLDEVLDQIPGQEEQND